MAEKEDIVSLTNAMEKAVGLGRVKMSYKGSSPENFTDLFEGASHNAFLKLLRLKPGGGNRRYTNDA